MSKQFSFYDKFKTRSYYKENLEEKNRQLAVILFFLSLLGIGFAAGSYFKLFSISYTHCIAIFLLGLFLTIVQRLLNKNKNFQEIAKYTGLILLAFFVSIISVIPGVGLSVYTAFILGPFFCSLYFSLQLSIITSIVSYILMIASLYINSHSNILFNVTPKIPTELFVSEFLGYSCAYVFVFALALSVSNAFKKALTLEFEKQNKIEELKYDLIETFAHIIEWSDKYTGLHIQRTSKYVELIAKKLAENGYYKNELTPEYIKLMVSAAPLHDVGKINVPNNILCKNGKFTPDEFEIMQTHSRTGYNIIINELSRFEDENYVKLASQMALYHHERWDGSGYPNKIKEKEIPLCGRIMAAADVLDALLSKRQYKEKFSIEETFRIFDEQRNRQFESCIVDAVFALKDEIAEIDASN